MSEAGIRGGAAGWVAAVSARPLPRTACWELSRPHLPALAGPNHVSMQQTAPSTLPTTSMSMSGGGHGTGPGYSHSGPASQTVPMQGQGTISSYVSRTNINMPSNPGTHPPVPWLRAPHAGRDTGVLPWLAGGRAVSPGGCGRVRGEGGPRCGSGRKAPGVDAGLVVPRGLQPGPRPGQGKEVGPGRGSPELGWPRGPTWEVT